MVQVLNDYMRSLNQRAGYQEIKTPLLYNKGLWEISGHWGKYRENMFLVLDNETGEHDFSLKPMNCPSHHLYFGTRKHSYRELPLGFATYDVLHRNEVSGALGGLTRVRQFQQDDCHIYLMGSQIADEVRRITDMILELYATFGLTATLKFATRPEQRIGDDAMWDRAEADLRAALEATGKPYELKPGDGAFYGPKIDFDVSDSIGRKWQLGTIQLDYAAPERFDLIYVGEDNAEHRPVVIHRAMYGIVRALHRDPDRALRRRVPGLAGARAGAGDSDLGRADRGCPRPRRAARGRGHPHTPRRPARNAQLPDPRGRGMEGPVHGHRRPAGGRERQPRPAGAWGGEEAGSDGGRGFPGAGFRGCAGAGAGALAAGVACVPAAAMAREALRSLQGASIFSIAQGIERALTLPPDPPCPHRGLTPGSKILPPAFPEPGSRIGGAVTPQGASVRV